MSAPQQADRPRILRASQADLEEIMAIERASFTTPWSARSIADEIGRPWSIFRVLRDSRGQLCAYLNFWVVFDELHILNLATHPAHRRRGHARRLMEYLIEKAHDSAASEVVREVRRSNEAARRLYESLGFSAVGLRPGYYNDTREDAIIYGLKITPAQP